MGHHIIISSITMAQSDDDDDELELSLEESRRRINSMQVSKTVANGENSEGKKEHILHNVEGWRSRKDAKEQAEAVEKMQQFKVK